MLHASHSDSNWISTCWNIAMSHPWWHISNCRKHVHTHITLERQKSERRKIDIAWRRFLCNSILLRLKPSRAKCEVFITSFEGVFYERWFSWVIKIGTLVAHVLRAIIYDAVSEFAFLAWVETGWTRWHIDYIVKGSKRVRSNFAPTTKSNYRKRRRKAIERKMRKTGIEQFDMIQLSWI